MHHYSLTPYRAPTPRTLLHLQEFLVLVIRRPELGLRSEPQEQNEWSRTSSPPAQGAFALPSPTTQ